MQRWICVSLLGLVCTAVCTLPLAAQEAPSMSSDRPDFTEGTSTLLPGQVQVEGGTTWEESGDEDILTVGELLVRIGVGEKLEARVGVGSLARIDLPFSERLEGYEDPELSLKIRLTDPAGDRPPGLPAVALLLATTVPVGGEELTADTWQPTLLFAFDWELTDRLSIGSNVGYSYAGDEDDQLSQGFASVVAGIAATDRLGVFLEGEVSAVQIGLGMGQARQGAGGEGNRHCGDERGAYPHRSFLSVRWPARPSQRPYGDDAGPARGAGPNGHGSVFAQDGARGGCQPVADRGRCRTD
jgi:hypothetical protein